jgi:hypothetical protein
MSLSRAQQVSVGFSSDGVATALVIDLSLAPPALDFRGNSIQNIRNVAVTATGGVTVPSFTVGSPAGSSVTVTFSSAPPETDTGGNTVLYTLAFLLTYNN